MGELLFAALGLFLALSVQAQEEACLAKPAGCTLECRYGYGRAFTGCLCQCNDPCKGFPCKNGEVCLVKKNGQHLMAECLSSIDKCMPGVSHSQCFVNVCLLSPCSANTSLMCIPDFCGGCFARYFDQNRNDVTSRCFPFTSSLSARVSKDGYCPKLDAGYCLDTCESHADCLGNQLCCSNGCGRLCIAPDGSDTRRQPTDPTPSPLTSTLPPPPPSPFWPNPLNNEKLGSCPRPSTDGGRDVQCKELCKIDNDCPSVSKCCNNGCSKRCTYPERATACIHLRAAVEQLPGGSVQNGWLPTCTPGGQFTSIQCSRNDCWCVDDRGFEVPQTRTATSTPNCQNGHSCEWFDCQRVCLAGFKLDERGCRKCECVDLCENVVCAHGFEICQQVQIQCSTDPPCSPIPKCLPSVCPIGRPVNTGFCTTALDCPADTWCHQIGYNGQGICCTDQNGISATIRPGSCPATTPNSGGTCHLECKIDRDCPPEKKCCFNGCGMSCMTAREPAVAEKQGQCPQIQDKSGPCLHMCQFDSDCAGTSKCCNVGCSKRCLSPGTIPGPTSYIPPSPVVPTQPQSRAPNTTPVCPPLTCMLYCPYGLKLAPDGCLICECKHPCDDLSCLNPGEICLILPRGCANNSGTECKPQPVCIQNVCPSGEPKREGFTGAAVQCDRDALCPKESWCQQVGLTTKGFCCPFPVAMVTPGECPVITGEVRFTGGLSCGKSCRSDDQCLPGPQKCCYSTCGYLACTAPVGSPTISPNAGKPGSCPVSTNVGGACIQACYTDFDCPNKDKCCQAGCSTICSKPMEESATPERTNRTNTRFEEQEKIGVCPQAPKGSICATDVAECSHDSQCNSVKKCCFDGCIRRCLYPDLTTTCLHMQRAMEESGLSHMMPACRVNGKYTAEQCRGNTCWCVTEHGQKVPGTLNQGAPKCESPRMCSLLLNCTLRCVNGYQLDNTGCAVCACENPCSDILCPHRFQLCMLTEVRCYPGEPCPPVPRCTVNVCPTGTPALNPQNQVPVSCKRSDECPRGYWCQQVGTLQGYCCSGLEPRYHPGECPSPLMQAPPTPNSCQMLCRSDSDCPDENSRCCNNGCGMSCLGAVQSERDGKCPTANASLANNCRTNCRRDVDCSGGYLCCQAGSCQMCLPALKVVKKIGECAQPVKFSSVNCSSTALNSRAECDDDGSCSFNKKCCQDMCGVPKCLYPAVTSSCFHYQASAEMITSQGGQWSKTGWHPRCQETGSYKEVQCDTQNCWCVDGEGIEIPGTRLQELRPPDCTNPRPCPSIVCSLYCPYGFKLDDSGCERCACYDPCESVQCGFNFQVCRLHKMPCLLGECVPVPKCIANICPAGDPLRDKDSWVIRSCADNSGCPPTHFCHKVGYDSEQGYCCVGPIMLSYDGICPVTPALQNAPSSLCQRSCSRDQECMTGKKCCFNGCTTSCLEVNIGNASTPVSRSMHAKIGICPTNPISNPGCITECNTDSDCTGVEKCCSFGCGRQCQFPANTTACIHWTSALQAISAKWQPKCDEKTGQYTKVQCDNDYCWCVNEASGLEILGTRAATYARPDCDRPKSCGISCSLACSHGIQLDNSGCPKDGLCRCRDPCKETQCNQADEVCVMEKVACLSGLCPPIPKCVRHGCQRGEPLRDVISNQPVVCTGIFNNECGLQHGCKILRGQRVGLCCPLWQDTNAVPVEKIGICQNEPVVGCEKTCMIDNTCEGTKKCCNGCCTNPFNTTNCLQYKAAIDVLMAKGLSQFINYQPSCEQRSGLFVLIQCSMMSSDCWCVDTMSGLEIMGTRRSGERPTCRPNALCPTICDPKMQCPFGYDVDKQGCPFQNCSCKDPCENIRCTSGEVCVLRDVACLNPPCLLVPKCEPNLCTTGVPIRNPLTLTLVMCRRMEDCPSEHFCVNGVCCRGTTVTIRPAQLPRCEYGRPLTDVTGLEVTCHKSRPNCLQGYSCNSSPLDLIGICCPIPPGGSNFLNDTSKTVKVKFRLLDRPLLTNKDAYKQALIIYLSSFGVRQEDVINVEFTNDGAVEVELGGSLAPSHALQLHRAIESGAFELRLNENPVDSIYNENENTHVQTTTNRTFTLLLSSITTTAVVPTVAANLHRTDKITPLQMTLQNTIDIRETSTPTATTKTNQVTESGGATPSKPSSPIDLVVTYGQIDASKAPTKTAEPDTALVGLLASCGVFAVVAVVALVTAVVTLHRRKKRAEGVSRLLLDSYRPPGRVYLGRSARDSTNQIMDTSTDQLTPSPGSLANYTKDRHYTVDDRNKGVTNRAFYY